MQSTWYVFPSCWISNSIRELGSRGSKYRIKSSLVRYSWRIQVTPSRTSKGFPPLYRPQRPPTEGDQHHALSGITTRRVIAAMTNRPQAGVCDVCDESPTEGWRGNLWTWQQVPAPSPGRSFPEQDVSVSHTIPCSKSNNNIQGYSPKNHFQG